MTGPSTKRRSLVTSQGNRVEKVYRQDGSVLSDLSFNLPPVKGIQFTVSEGHPWESRDRNSTDDIGGDFYTTKSYVKGRPHKLSMTARESAGLKRSWKFSGPFMADDPIAVGFPTSFETPDSVLDQMGATAVARCAPTNSPADLATFLGEQIKDGIPSLIGAKFWKDRAFTARTAGSEYLNYQFGWVPLVTDVKKFLSVVSHTDAVLAQYERDAGNIVRRGYEFPLLTEVSETTRPNRYPHGPGDTVYYGNTPSSSVNPGKVRKVVTKSRRTWFRGAFTYSLPTGYDSRGALGEAASKAQILFGLEITPETLWNLAPWSWAIDWFSNAGDVLSNISDAANHGLVMRYGYIMEHSVHEVSYIYEPGTGHTRYRNIPPLTLVTETKRRRRANPFGFGISWEGLSPYQLSIAAALGISRKQ